MAPKHFKIGLNVAIDAALLAQRRDKNTSRRHWLKRFTASDTPHNPPTNGRFKTAELKLHKWWST